MSENVPSIFEIFIVFFGLVIGMGAWKAALLIAVFSYCFMYAKALQNAAKHDPRNVKRLETYRYANIIFWERLQKVDPLAILNAICIPLGPILFIMLLTGSMKK